jgi:hypothetical protein
MTYFLFIWWRDGGIHMGYPIWMENLLTFFLIGGKSDFLCKGKIIFYYQLQNQWPSFYSWEIVGLWDCGIVGLWDCWIVGLLDCWIVGLTIGRNGHMYCLLYLGMYTYYIWPCATYCLDFKICRFCHFLKNFRGCGFFLWQLNNFFVTPPLLFFVWIFLNMGLSH